MSANSDASVFVRNLVYETTDAQLEEHFSDAGPVRGAFVVRDKVTKVGRGFGFVQFVLPDDAQRAVEMYHGKSFKGRNLSVDIAKKGADASSGKPPKKAPRALQPTGAAAASSSGDASAAPPAASGKGKGSDRGDGPNKAFRLIVRNLSFKADETALRAAFAPHGSVKEVHMPTRPDGKHRGFGFVQMSSRAECERAVKAVNENSIVGRVVAVDYALSKDRYDQQASEEQIRSVLSPHGALQYVRIVRDPATKLSKGTAFACFVELAAMQAALGATGGRMTFLGQELYLNCALKKTDADSQADARRNARDAAASRRNLHLAKNGLKTAADGPAFDDLPAVEKKKREAAWATKKEKLKSPNFIVSDVRLSIRNLPTSVTEAKLRTLALTAASNAPESAGAPRLKQVKIIRDDARADERGEARSRGFGFVHFEEHAHALACLEGLADNDSLLANQRMLLVEFAVDNTQKLRAKGTRLRKRSSSADDAEFGRPNPNGKRARKEASRGEDRFESLVADYKSRLAGKDVAAQLKEWM